MPKENDMIHYLLPQNTTPYKANLHTHSTLSDGRLTVGEVKQTYMDHGYQIVAFTDHDIMIDHSDLNEENKFLALTSYEIETNDSRPGIPWNKLPCYHLNFYAKNPHETYYPCANPAYTFGNAPKYVQDYYRGDYQRVYSVDCQNEMIREAVSHNFLVSYNHPAWSLQHYPDYAGLAGFQAVEVYNTGCVFEGYALDASEHVYEDFLRMGKRVFPFAGDDSHGPVEACGAWTTVFASGLTYDTVMAAIERGDLYASWGPEITALYLRDTVLCADIKGAASVNLTTDGRESFRALPSGDPDSVFRFEYDIAGWLRQARDLGITDTAYFRLTVIDRSGNKALTRGYFADELGDVIC